MLIAVEDVIDESVDDGGLPHRLIPQKDYLVFEQRRNSALREVQVANVRHPIYYKQVSSVRNQTKMNFLLERHSKEKVRWVKGIMRTDAVCGFVYNNGTEDRTGRALHQRHPC